MKPDRVWIRQFFVDGALKDRFRDGMPTATLAVDMRRLFRKKNFVAHDVPTVATVT
jgi:hypothetical protein